MTSNIDMRHTDNHRGNQGNTAAVASRKWLPIGLALMLCIFAQTQQIANASSTVDPECVKVGSKMFVQSIQVVWAIKGEFPASNQPYRLKAPDGRIITEGRTDGDGMIRIVLKRRLVPKGAVIETFNRPDGPAIATIPAVSEC